MDIDAKVVQAYHTVQLSTREMLKNNRRQHYCNMIDLLARSCKASGLINTSFTNEELVEFWLGDILPLMFDSDRKIQDISVAAMAEALVAFDVTIIHAAKCWPQVRNEFVNNYTTLVGKMRDAKNNNWHKIWTLLVQIMDSELLRGCTYINKFLAVVELGFRSPDNGVRSEAFLCWRVLIKIFAAYNELAVGKRLRLLLIPLRTSQSRSAHVSSIKVRVWWYLLTCLDAELPKSFNTAVESFLSFLFGGGARGNATGMAHNYQAARELSLPCLVALWNLESNSKSLEQVLRNMRLEVLNQPSPLMNAEFLQQYWGPMLAGAVVAMKLLNQSASSLETEQELLHLLLRNLTLAMFKLRVAPFTVACCAELEKTISGDGSIVRSVFNTCAALAMHPVRVDSLEILEAYMKLSLKARAEVPPAIMQRCVSLIYAPKQLEACNTCEFRQLVTFAEMLMKNNDDEDYETFSVKLLIWRQVTLAILNYMRDNSLAYGEAHNATVVDNWILWPMHTCASFAKRRANSPFDGAFCELWRQLINAGYNSNDRMNFVAELKAALVDHLKIGSKEEPHFAEIFDIYVHAVLKLGICKDAPLYKDVFAVLQALLERPALSQSLLEGCLNTLRNVILELRQNELIVIFDALKPTLAAVLHCWTKSKCEGSFLIEWKRTILEKFRKLSTKSMANQLKELFKGDELFVIIPSIWSLNPDKLTDRQKERLAEKSDIPALYNDMSQSLDSSIKPWTPKKVVIAKSKQSELSINAGQKLDCQNDQIKDVVVIKESPSELLTFTAVVSPPTRRLLINETDSTEDSTLETYKFRKLRAQTEEESKSSFLCHEGTPTGRQMRKRGEKDNSMDQQTIATEKLRSPRKQLGKSQTAACSQNLKGTAKQSEDLFPAFATSILTSTPTNATSIELSKKTSNELETQMGLTFEPVVESVATTQIPSEHLTDPTFTMESSPRKESSRVCNLNSPPDRKQTNNSTSPTLRPKPSAHLTGRGAQLINMIRNKKLDAGTICNTHSSSSASSGTTRNQVPPARLMERPEMVATPTIELNDLVAAEHTSTPKQAKDLLIFSKRLPSPSASPSASILKRKLRCESFDDFESPALKRKRVSFHDPPVSITKEYLRDVDDTRSSKPKRCLLLAKIAPTPEVRQALKRRGRLDSIIEIEKFAHEETARNAELDKSKDKSHDPVEEENLDSLKWNDTTISYKNIKNCSVEEMQVTGAAMDTPLAATLPSRDSAILDAESALDLVVEHCTLETVLTRYFSKPHGTPIKSALHIAQFLSNQMSENNKLKTNVLETLSENHSKDFLDHAVRENLSSVVCDRLNPNSVLEYICAKSKINNTCRSNLLAQVPAMIRLDEERMTLLQHLLQQCSLRDDQLLDLIAQLMLKRDIHSTERISCPKDSVNDNVSETAADSSSNL